MLSHGRELGSGWPTRRHPTESGWPHMTKINSLITPLERNASSAGETLQSVELGQDP
jgi:hypothetical protein